jgi:hypothetical protein
MRFVRALAVAGLMLAGAPSGFADKVSSSALRFSADFPGAVQQGAPEDNATDENDRVISRVTPFEDAVAGRYLALVMVDTYITPYPIEASARERRPRRRPRSKAIRRSSFRSIRLITSCRDRGGLCSCRARSPSAT